MVESLTWTQFAIQALKFVAIFVAAASGIWAMFNETKDKDTKALTPAGRFALGLLVLSNVVALAMQSLETKNTLDAAAAESLARSTAEARADIDRREADRQRTEQYRRLETILTTAEYAGTQASTSARQSTAAVSSLIDVTNRQRASAEQVWRLARPFGHWQGQLELIDLQIPDTADVREWKDRVHQSAVSQRRPPSVLEIKSGDPLFPGESLASLLPAYLGVWLSAHPRHVDGHLVEVTDDADMRLDLNVESVTLRVSLADGSANVTGLGLSAQYVITQGAATSAVTNWIDLYGSELTVGPLLLTPRAEISRLWLSYRDTISPKEVRIEWRGDARSRNFLSLLLAHDVLGPFPQDYVRQFPQFPAARRQEVLLQMGDQTSRR